ncbi:hypothetical protein [Salarchaeum japonicum]|uniref:hypothetical protein n=1 Tax=Salarchaeum japonicum TaxID=555573 RepID=UPI003C75BEE9
MAPFTIGPRTYTRITAAALCSTLLFIPILLAGLPASGPGAFPGPLERGDAVLLFFVSVPVLFGLFAVYRVAQNRELIGSRQQD